MRLQRRALLAFASGLLLTACASTPGTAPPPIVFVHGNGDTAALWTTTLWRYESNGWPRERLHAVDFPLPQARDDDTKPQDGRSSATEQREFLAAEVQRVLQATGASQVVLIGNSRGGNAIRNYIQNGGGDKTVSHALLGGTPNHGVWANPGFRPNNEFNGAGAFLTGLNAPKGPNADEVTPGLRWMTTRSDSNDKFAQPDGVWIGAKGTPTHVTAEGPALKGAHNVVLPGRDHREVSYHPQAFAAAYEFITGQAPALTTVTPEASVLLDGKVSGIGAGGPTNLPLAGAQVAVYAVDAATGARRGAALVDKAVGADGRWGPLSTDSATPLEFVISAPGYATTHIYRAPFARSSAIVHLRAERLAEADKSAASVVTLTRPRGYLGLPRDSISFDGLSPAPGIPPGVAGVSSSKLKLQVGPGRPVVAEYRSGELAERIVGIAWPARDNHVVTIELHP
ncbi:twin-arginine translocation pathway signal [Aquabacterium sp.]|uniref:twin-arginine translocation pathway signal n=1 Tax=Aquabacterium sp. TaxID=1872578 RepID=UPI002C796E3B|nr:twin-arginine translocation pathway signal [Aquabacterium sp.]HSW09048.1 twin-arginine translocation pathway signal [Aquabacterium sp.]